MTLSPTPGHSTPGRGWPPHAPAGRRLEAPFYTDREFFDLDLAAIFARHWLFVAHDAEIPEPGDYSTVEIGPYSVIVVRDDDEDARAFHNVCRHRGARILDGAGSVATSSAATTSGRTEWTARSCTPRRSRRLRPELLRPQVGARAQRRRADLPLPRRRAPGRLRRGRRPHRAVPQPHRLRRAKVAAQIDLVEDGNWKLVMENNRECYHCDGPPRAAAPVFPTYGYADETHPRRDCGRPRPLPAADRDCARPARARPAVRRASRNSGPRHRLPHPARAAGPGRGVVHPRRHRRLPPPPGRAPHPAPGPALDAPAAQRLVPLPRRPRDHLLASCRWPRTGRWCAPPGWCTRTPWRARTTTSRS